MLKPAHWFNKSHGIFESTNMFLDYITFACYHLLNIYSCDKGEGAVIW